MCGIVGYIGSKTVTPLLIEGLKRLEYRGYDSAGVAVMNGKGVETRRAAGKIVRLEQALNTQPVHGTLGIGHTRWATHGAPTEHNAHPHTDEGRTIAVVHNGIIENATALRQTLEEAGHVFSSETDTEVLAHLIEELFEDTLENAVMQALSRVVEDVAAEAGRRVIRAPVGEVNVATRMRSEGAAVGGEGNGGVILPELHLGRDAPVGAALILHLMAGARRPLSAIVGDYPRYAIVKDKLDRPEASLAAVYESLREAFPDAHADMQDGLRLSWPDRWVHVRPSGTEPIVRVIAEAPTAAYAHDLIARSRVPLDALARA